MTSFIDHYSFSTFALPSGSTLALGLILFWMLCTDYMQMLEHDSFLFENCGVSGVIFRYIYTVTLVLGWFLLPVVSVSRKRSPSETRASSDSSFYQA